MKILRAFLPITLSFDREKENLRDFFDSSRLRYNNEKNGQFSIIT